MMEYLKTWLELKTDRRAVTALEYGLIAAIMAVIIIGGVGQYSGALQNKFNHIRDIINNNGN